MTNYQHPTSCPPALHHSGRLVTPRIWLLGFCTRPLIGDFIRSFINVLLQVILGADSLLPVVQEHLMAFFILFGVSVTPNSPLSGLGTGASCGGVDLVIAQISEPKLGDSLGVSLVFVESSRSELQAQSVTSCLRSNDRLTLI